jgi:uncharacterized protein (PEP-CTERM system associated)
VASGAAVPLSTSSVTTVVTLQNDLKISQDWSAALGVSYTNVKFTPGDSVSDFWTVNPRLKYDMFRNVTLTLEYQYMTQISNQPLSNYTRNYIGFDALYKF